MCARQAVDKRCRLGEGGIHGLLAAYIRDARRWRANHTRIKQRECSISIRDCAGLAAISVLLRTYISLKRKKEIVGYKEWI